MKLTGLHLLLTYQCNFECDHCFVWGSPWQSGTMTLQQVRHILKEAKATDSVESIYFEGGEPFLYYPIMLRGVREAADMGFRVGIVSNSYWATTEEDALEWLAPLAGLIQDLSISGDLYHYDEEVNKEVQNALAAAEKLDVPVGTISISQPEISDNERAIGQLKQGESPVMYRGRAAVELIERASWHPWVKFTECPYEDLENPKRFHVDHLGNLHLCQGISLGCIYDSPLTEICQQFNPDKNPIIGPLAKGGPVELVKRYDLAHEERYVDACHLCYEMRLTLRDRFPDILTPDQMYSVPGCS